MDLPSYSAELKEINWSRKWYSNLIYAKGNSCLLDNLDSDDCMYKIVIAREYKNNGHNFYKYAWFASVTDFYDYRELHIKEKLEPTFNEVITK